MRLSRFKVFARRATRNLESRPSRAALKTLDWDALARELEEALVEKLERHRATRKKARVFDLRWDERSTALVFDVDCGTTGLPFENGLSPTVMFDFSEVCAAHFSLKSHALRDAVGEDDYALWVSLWVKLAAELALGLTRSKRFLRVPRQKRFIFTSSQLHGTPTTIFFDSAAPRASQFTPKGTWHPPAPTAVERFAAALDKGNTKRLLAALEHMLMQRQVREVDEAMVSLVVAAYSRRRLRLHFVALAKVLLAHRASFDGDRRGDGLFVEHLENPLMSLVGVAPGDLELASTIARAWGRRPFKVPGLPFNLACAFALAGLKRRLLKMVSTALAAGQPHESFMSDGDFARYQADPQFLAAVGAKVSDRPQLDASLIKALRARDLKRAAQHLAEGAGGDAVDEDFGESALTVAFGLRRVPPTELTGLIDLLLEHGGEVKGDELAAAVRSQPLSVIEHLAARGIDVLGADDAQPALFQAVGSKSVPLVQWFLNAGANPNARKDTRGASRGDTPLMESLESANLSLEVAKVLLDAGADPNGANEFGSTPLMACVFDAHLPHLELLLSRGARVGLRDGNGHDALFRVVTNGASVAVLQALLRAGADPRALDKAGNSLLHVAVEHGAGPVLDAVLTLGLDPNLQNGAGQTALHLAVLGENLAVTKRLLSLPGVDRALRDVRGQLAADAAESAQLKALLS